MTTPSVPAATAPQRRTRVPDWLTDVVLIVTAVFGAWAVVLIVLTFVGITQPAAVYSDPKAAVKALGSTVVVVLAGSQLYTMYAAMGRLPRGSFKMKHLMRAHRYGGRTAIALAAVIAFFCIVDVGAPTNPPRVVIHAISGATAFTALGLKFALIRLRPPLAYDLAPRLGLIAAVAFLVIWVSSGLAYFTGNL